MVDVYKVGPQSATDGEPEVGADEDAVLNGDVPEEFRQAAARLREEAARLREEAARLRQELESVRQAATFKRIAPAKENGEALEQQVTQLRDANEHLVAAAVEAQARSEVSEHDKEQMSHAAHFDFLTDLPNRLLLNDRVTHAIRLAHRHRSKVAVLFVDLDRFKEVNDSLGHSVGDQLLQSVAQRLKSALRSSDTISRLGGDEFVVLLSEVVHAHDAAVSAEKIRQAVAQPHFIASHKLDIAASVGISLYPEDGLDADSLINRADRAMYHAKENGRNNQQFFKPEMEDAVFGTHHSRDHETGGGGNYFLPREEAATGPGGRANYGQFISQKSVSKVAAVATEDQVDQLRQANEHLVVAAIRAHTLTEASASHFRLLVKEVTDCAIYMLSLTGNVISWNKGAQRITGYAAEEIVGQHFSRFYSPEDVQAGAPVKALETATQEGHYEAEGWRLRRDGSRFWANVVIDPIRDEAGELFGFAKITLDITERQEAQKLLREQTTELQSLSHFLLSSVDDER